MNSLGFMQDQLAEFDKLYWRHERGIQSIQHTTYHLVEASFRYLPQQGQYASEWLVHMPLRILEHALRLANNCGINLTEMWFEKVSMDYDQMIRNWLYGKLSSKRLEVLQKDFERKMHEYIFSFLHGLTPLIKVCREFDHNPDLNNECIKCIADACYVLIGEAAWFGFDSEITSTHDDPLHQLTLMFQTRLDDLYAQFAQKG